MSGPSFLYFIWICQDLPMVLGTAVAHWVWLCSNVSLNVMALSAECWGISWILLYGPMLLWGPLPPSYTQVSLAGSGKKARGPCGASPSHNMMHLPMVRGKVPVLPVFLVRNTSVSFILEELLDVCHFPLKCISFPHCFRIPLHVSALFLLWPLLGILPSLPCCDVLLMRQPWLEALLRGSG